MRSLLVLAVSSLALAAPPKERPYDAAAAALAAHIKTNDRKVLVDVVNGETTWSDSAMLERNRSFPRSIQALLEAPAPDRKLEPGKVAAFVDAYQQHRDGYVEATVERTGAQCFVVNGATRALVNCLYVDYLQERYAKARFLVHGALEPLIFIEKDRVRAMLMPMKP